MIENQEPSDDENDELNDPEPLSLVGEIKSLWLGAVALVFSGNATLYLQDEIDLASWRRFWVAMMSSVIVGALLPDIGLRIFRQYLGIPVPEETTVSLIFNYLWFGMLLLLPFVAVFCIGIYLCRRWLKYQGVATDSDFLEHANMAAVVFLSRQIFYGLLSLIGVISSTLVVARTVVLSDHKDTLPISTDVARLISFMSVVLLVVIVLYSYWLMSRVLKILYQDIRGRQLWSAVAILFFATDGLRLLVSYMIGRFSVIEFLRADIHRRLFGF